MTDEQRERARDNKRRRRAVMTAEQQEQHRETSRQGMQRSRNAAAPAGVPPAPAPQPMDVDAPSVVDGVLRDTADFLCRPVEVPRVWSREDERIASQRLAQEVAAAMPTTMCAVCARLRRADDVAEYAPADVSKVHLLLADGPRSPELPRDALTTFTFDDGSRYCLHPDGTP